MAEARPPAQERRRRRRLSPDQLRIWCVSGEFEELYTTVNFAKGLLNISLDGLCVETTGRLRPQVKMSVEVRFDKLGGALRSEARVVWADTVKSGGLEVHRAGLKFTGSVDATRPVREYLEGEDSGLIVARRQIEYRELKRNSEARKEGVAPKKRGILKKAAVALFILAFCYVASYGGFVLAGRKDSPGPTLRYRYLASDSKGAENVLAKIYAPLYWASRKVGVDLSYDPP